MEAFETIDETSIPPVAVEGPHGLVRLKWHKLRTRVAEAPFKLSNLTLGWRLAASLEVDILATGDGRFVVLHDPTLGPSTTGRGRVTQNPIASMKGLFHRDAAGIADPDAPVLSLADLAARLRTLPRAPSANLQLDLKLLDGHALPDSAIADAAEAIAGLALSSDRTISTTRAVSSPKFPARGSAMIRCWRYLASRASAIRSGSCATSKGARPASLSSI